MKRKQREARIQELNELINKLTINSKRLLDGKGSLDRHDVSSLQEAHRWIVKSKIELADLTK